MKKNTFSFKKLRKKTVSLILAMSIAIPGMLLQNTGSITADELAPYYNTNLTFEERAAALVSMMTNEEKVAQLNTTAPAIPRLGVRAYQWWQEAIRGPRNIRALSFPTGVGMSMSWDDELFHEMSSIIGDECRAWFRQNGRPLSQFCPTINLARDPRWGRNEEGFGEDPYLVGRLGKEYIMGMQGEKDTGEGFYSPSGEKYIKAIATPKHYAANNSEFDRYVGDSQMDERELREYYTYHFRYIELNSNPGSLMTAYNRVNSVPMYAHTYLNNTMLRKMWGFGGYVVSDCDGIANMRNDHHWNPSVSYPQLTQYTDRVTLAQAAAFSLMGGTDLSCTWTSGSTTGGFYGNSSGGGNVKDAITQGVITDNGLMTWDAVDRALVRMFTQRMATGEFDTTETTSNRNVGGIYGTYTQATHLETAANTAVSLESSHKSIALLKNEDNILPINLDKVKTISVVGKFLDRVELGDNNYASNPTQRTTYRQGITNVLNAKGFDTANNLRFFSPGTPGSTVSGYIFNVRNMKINGNQINTQTAATSLSGATRNTGSDPHLDNINDFGHALYANIDHGGQINTFEIELATQNATGNWQPVIELRVGGPTGQLISRVQCQRTGGWQTYSWNTGTISNDIIHSDDPLCLVFTTSTSSPAIEMTDAQADEIAAADVVIYIAGTGKEAQLDVARENRDRVNMNFPAGQADEIKKLLAKNPNVILPIQAVGMMNITEFVDNPDPTKNVKAALFTGFNGQFQGIAMADVLFGNVNPTARLSFTWYADESQMPPMPPYTTNQRNNPVDVDYSIRPTEDTPWGRTYQYYTGDVLYPFGYGLSYSTYEYSNPRISKSTVTNAEKLYVEVDVKNTSTVDGAEVVQVYMTPPGAGTNGMPYKQLKGYTRVDLLAGETKTVRVDLDTDEWWFIDNEGKRVVNEGVYGLQIGRSTEDIKHTFNVTISGKVAPWIQNVNLDTDTILVTSTRPANSELSIALSDETFLDPAQATVVYSSSKPSVAAVSQSGVVTRVNSGTAVITATVTYGGQTMSDSYAVVVDVPTIANAPIIDSIEINGTAVTGFSMSTRTYSHAVAPGAAIPTVSATYGNNNVDAVTIEQATAIPGTATVTAVRDGITVVFTINFIRADTSNMPKISKTAETPDIDSGQWARADVLEVNTIVQNTASTLATGKALLLWDAENLYVRVDVTDPDVNTVNSSAHLKDSVEIYLSEQAARGSYTSSNGNQYRLNADGGFSQKSSTNQTTTITNNAWRRVVRKTAYGYQIYLAIPLTTNPVEGAIFTFDVQINDATTPANDRTGQTTWKDPAANGYSSADGWGEIVLAVSRPLVYKTAETPNIGSAQWAQAEVLEVSTIAQDSASTLATGEARLLRDDNNLYVRVDVTDPDVNTANSTAHLKDSVEIYLSEQAARGSYTSSNGNQYRLNADGGFSQKSNTDQTTAITDNAWRRVARRTAYGYQIYLAIPLTTNPVVGAIFTFDVQINDATTPANTRTGQTTWKDPAANGYNSADEWGEIKLAGPLPKLSGLIVTGADGETLTGLTSTELHVTMPYENVDDQPANLVMYVAVYDASGKLVHVGNGPQTVMPGETKNLNTTLAMPQNIDGSYQAKGYYVYVFLWRQGTFIPVTDKINPFS